MTLILKNKFIIPSLIIFAASFASGLIFTNAQTVPPTEQCTEIPFATVIQNLESGRRAQITEYGFSSWASQGREDISGDIDEIHDYINETGTCSALNLNLNPNYGSVALTSLFNRSTNINPTIMGFMFNDLQTAHAVILLDIKKTNTTDYNLTILNLDIGTSVENVSCRAGTTIVLPSGPLTSTLCFYKDTVVIPMPPEAIPGIDSLTQNLINARRNDPECNDDFTRNSDFCIRNVSTWLKNNYPNISNFTTPENPIGVCAGWAKFVLRVGYLGDFIGDCPAGSTSCVRPDGTTTSP